MRLLFLNSNWPQLKLGNLEILSSELRLKLTLQKRLLQLPKLLEIQGTDSEVMCGVLLLSSRSLSISVSGATRLLRVEALASDRASLKACRTVLWAKLCDRNDEIGEVKTQQHHTCYGNIMRSEPEHVPSR